MLKNRILPAILISAIVILAFAGCGVTTTGNTQGSAAVPQATPVGTSLPVITQTTPTTSPPAIAPTSTNTTSGTISGSQIVIATDHSVYTSNEVIGFTVTNNSNNTIYAFDTQSSCTAATLEVQNGQNWTPTTETGCAMGRPAAQIAIQPGSSYSAKIGPAIGSIKSTPLPTGNYRLRFTYSTTSLSSSDMTPAAGMSAVIYSLVIQIQ